MFQTKRLAGADNVVQLTINHTRVNALVFFSAPETPNTPRMLLAHITSASMRVVIKLSTPPEAAIFNYRQCTYKRKRIIISANCVYRPQYYGLTLQTSAQRAGVFTKWPKFQLGSALRSQTKTSPSDTLESVAAILWESWGPDPPLSGRVGVQVFEVYTDPPLSNAIHDTLSIVSVLPTVAEFCMHADFFSW